jgi:hypothetical protein
MGKGKHPKPDLRSAAAKFLDEFPKYNDVAYREVVKSIGEYAQPGRGQAISTLLASDQFTKAWMAIRPVIMARNYKSQIAFPVAPMAIAELVALVIDLRCSKPGKHPWDSQKVRRLFGDLIVGRGFRLPMVSALFHFSHPTIFPIVDVNVQRACAKLKRAYPDLLGDLAAPKLPGGHVYKLGCNGIEDLFKAYEAFDVFIRRLRAQRKILDKPENLRFLDKALMVIGKGS